MKLAELLRGVEVLSTNVPGDRDIPALVYDSRKTVPGCLFAAITGFAADGNRFIPMALERGAAAVLTAKKPEGPVPYILVPDDRLALAQVSANFYRRPAASMKMIGVTGTNGKTTVTLLVKHILERTLGARVGLIGTMSNLIGQEELPTERTTPESLELQALFAQMRDAGCGYVVMEVSSHALALNRVGGVHYDVAAFTNLTEDHLDFHKTMDAYCNAKALLFGRCGYAVLNRDDPYASRMAKSARCPILWTSKGPCQGLSAQNIRLAADGVEFTAVLGEKRAPVKLGIPGGFSVSNALTALGIALGLGISLEAAAEALATAPGVKGRVEVVPTPGKPFTLLVDYAHTPDGLENVLSAFRPLCRGRLIAVFGCGGDRDPMKRPIMGEIGTRIADYSILTSDNPRHEGPEAIIRDIQAGIPADRANYEVIVNRVKAIHRALDIGQKGDIIILAGKGHETYQQVGDEKRPLDERQVVAAYLAETRE